VQELGKVVTRQDRLIAFPNVLQHSVQSFTLADPTRPGHRKILAMFLVDPHIRIISTANVPPQRRDWWAEEVRKVDRFAVLPREIFERIIDEVQDFPISWERALEIREELMGERGLMTEELNDQMTEVSRGCTLGDTDYYIDISRTFSPFVSIEHSNIVISDSALIRTTIYIRALQKLRPLNPLDFFQANLNALP